MKIIEHRENPFPLDLEGRLNAILNVVNNEFKIAALLHLDDTPVTGSKIRARIRETVGKIVDLPHQGNFNCYCHETFLPMGMVTEVITYKDVENVIIGYRYRATKVGKKYGIPIAAFTLDNRIEEDYSMYDVLGRTASKGNSRSPLNRIKILEELRNNNLREADLVERVGLDSSGIYYHLKALKKIGFIDYESCGEPKIESFVYEWIGGDIAQVRPVSHYLVTAKVAETLKELGEANYGQLAEILKIRSPLNTTTILSGLIKQGFVRRRKWKGGKYLSEVRLLDRGRSFLEYLDKIRDALSDGYSLKEMESLFEQLWKDKSRLREYLIKRINIYKRASPWLNKRPLEETQKGIISYVKSNPGIRPFEIAAIFSLSRVHTYLTPLIDSGMLRKVKDKKAARIYAA